MKRFALLSTVIAVVALALFAASAAQGEAAAKVEPVAGVMYDIWESEPEGILRIAHAEGDFVEVFAVNGEMVWCGIVPADYFGIGCPNRGVGQEGEILNVHTASGVHFCIDRDEDWIWE